MMGLKGRFLVVPPPADEAEIRERVQLRLSSTSPLPPLDPPEYARHLAGAKAAALAQHLVLELQEESAESSVSAAHTKWTIILGSDTIVDLDGSILEKPVDETDAGRMLKMLSGRRHSVHTGVALVCLGPRRGGDDGVTVATTTTTTSFVDTAVVQFASLTDEDIDAYVSTREPMDKAGSYGIQGIGGQMVRGIDGDFFTVSTVLAC
jgi:septum formation protein